MSAEQERASGTRTIQEATRIASKHGKVLAVKQYSVHPDDDYLYVVLVELGHEDRPAKEYGTWLVNTTCPGYADDHHFTGGNDSRAELETACSEFSKCGKL